MAYRLLAWDTSNNRQRAVADGSANQVLVTDGDGVLSWSSTQAGDITAVTAGVGLSGGGTSGGVTLTLDLSELSAVTPVAADSFSTLDSDGSTEQRTTITALSTLQAGTAASTGLSASSGVLSVSDLHPVGVDGSANQLITDDGDGTVTSEGNLSYDDTNGLLMKSSTTSKPALTIKNTHAGATGGFLQFVNDKGAAGADDDVCGTISFYGDDDAQDNIEFARIQGAVADASNGAEGGRLTLGVATHDGEMGAGLILRDGSAEDEIDVTIANGSASVTTVAGSMLLTTVSNAGSDTDKFLVLDGSGNVDFRTGAEVASDIGAVALSGNNTFSGNSTFTGTVTVGVDGTGKDVKFFGDTAGAYALWDESEDKLVVRGPVGTGTATPGVLRLETAELTVVDGDQLGRIEFIAPLETGSDAILVAAAIWAEADDTFAAAVNNTDLVFATGKSEAAAEKMRLDADGNLAITGDLTITGGNITNAITCDSTLGVTGALTAASLVCTAAATFGGGYGATGTTITTAGVITSNGACTVGGILKTDDTTAATSITDGSLQTDGGLSVALDAVVGDDLILLSDSSVIHFGAGKDVTLTHTNDVGLHLNAGMRLGFRDQGGEYLTSASDGHLEVNAGTTIDMTAPTVDINASSAVTIDGPSVIVASSGASEPVLHITNTHAGATSGELRFNKDSASGADSDVMGMISFYGTDDSDNTHERLAYMDAIITDSAHGSEAASLRFYVAENDATLTQGLLIAGQADDNGEVDVTIGAGAGSTCTIAGNLTVSGTTTTVNQTIIESTVSVLVFEGASADDHETTLKVVEPTADCSFSLPTLSAGNYFIPAIAGTATNASAAVTAAEFALLDGGSTVGTTAVANGDGIVTNDGGTMQHTTVQTFQTYFDANSVGGTSIVTTGALGAGSIATGFGHIDNGTSNLTSGGIWKVDVDATGTGAGLSGAAGTLNFGASADLNIYHDSANSYIVHNNTGDLVVETTAGGIILDTEDDTLEIKYSGSTGATFSTSGLNVVSGDGYSIAGQSTLSALLCHVNPATGDADTDNVVLRMSAGRGSGGSVTQSFDFTLDADGGLATAGSLKGSLRITHGNEGSNSTTFLTFYPDLTVPSGGGSSGAGTTCGTSFTVADDKELQVGVQGEFNIKSHSSSSVTQLYMGNNGDPIHILGTNGASTIATFTNGGSAVHYFNNAISTSTISGGMKVGTGNALGVVEVNGSDQGLQLKGGSEGIFSTFGVDNSSDSVAIAIGHVLYGVSDARPGGGLADADAAGSSRWIGVATTAAAAGGNATDMAISGVVDVKKQGSEQWGIGEPIYVDETTSGTGTKTAPTASGDFVSLIGICIEGEGSPSSTSRKVLLMPQPVTELA